MTQYPGPCSTSRLLGWPSILPSHYCQDTGIKVCGGCKKEPCALSPGLPPRENTNNKRPVIGVNFSRCTQSRIGSISQREAETSGNLALKGKLKTIYPCSLSFTLSHPHCCSWSTQGSLLPQGLCICWAFCMEQQSISFLSEKKVSLSVRPFFSVCSSSFFFNVDHFQSLH